MTRMIRLAVTTMTLLVLATALTPVAGGQTPPSLRELARQRHIKMGTAIGQPELGTDPEHLAVAAREYSSVTPENAMKWELVHPQRDRYDFTGADQTVAFAKAHHMTVRGHTLVWHSQNPSWLSNGSFTRDELIAILRDHIHTVVGHFAGRVQQWDVANEVVRDDGSGLRDNLWLRGIGAEYLAMAFQFAHEADPNAVLYLNDYSTDTVNPKSDFVLGLAHLLRHFDVPIQGIGIQSHRFLLIPEARADIEANLRRIARDRFRIWVTELDVAVFMPADATELADQATVYRDVVRACLAVRRCRGITTWGFTDRYSWIPSFFPGFGAALPFDEALTPKPAYQSMVDALRV
jgi:endo-1,4-beta-xylanase